jgi:hypothetical protein
MLLVLTVLLLLQLQDPGFFLLPLRLSFGIDTHNSSTLMVMAVALLEVAMDIVLSYLVLLRWGLRELPRLLAVSRLGLVEVFDLVSEIDDTYLYSLDYCPLNAQ